MSWEIRQGDALTVLRTLPDASVNCCITSPPYWSLRDYKTGIWTGGDESCAHVKVQLRRGLGMEVLGERYRGGGKKAATVEDIQFSGECEKCGAIRTDQQMGSEETFAEYVDKMAKLFHEVRRVLRDDGTLWINIGDSYNAGTAADRQTSKTSVGDGKHGYWVNPNINKRCRAGNLKPKDLVGIPWRLAFALQDDGWYLRADIIWHKPNPMPESVTDRPTKAHEYIFLLSKSPRYYYDADAIKEKASLDSHARYARGRSDTHKWANGGPGNQSIAKSFEHMRDRTPAGWHQGTRPATPSGIRDKKVAGVHPKSAEPGSGIKSNSSFSAAVKDLVDFRNKRSVWTISTMPTPDAHFATFPIELPEICLKAGCPEDGIVLDPFAGAGTTGLACLKNNRSFLGIELSAPYIEIAYKRAERHYPLLLGPRDANSNIG